jgi:cytochrome c oxidase subunit 2
MWMMFEFPKSISVWGDHIDELFRHTYELTMIAFLAVLFILIGCCVLYREKEGRKAEYFHGDQKIHILATAGLAALVFFGIDYQLEAKSRRVLEEYFIGFPKQGDEALRVEVRGEQFRWKFRYAGPDGEFGNGDDVVSYEFHVPVGRKVVVTLHSKDVIHSFYMPFIRLKQDAVPGITTSLWFVAREVGDYEVGCAELCGSGHTKMRNPFYVQSEADYEAWLQGLYAEEVEEDDPDMGEDENEDTGEYTNWGWTWKDRR